VIEPVVFDEAGVLLAVEQVQKEHRIYAICLALDPLASSLVQENWQRMRIQTEALLEPLQPSAAFVKKFEAASQSSRLLDVRWSLSEATVFCQKNQAQVSQFYTFGFTALDQAVNAVLHPKAVE
jgi:hypothetical protein